MWSIDYRDLNTIRAKLALLAAASIVDYEKLDVVKVNGCYETRVSVKPGLYAWLFIEFDGDATLEIDDLIYAAYTGNRIFRLRPGDHRVKLCLSSVGYSGGRFVDYKGMYVVYHEPRVMEFVIKALAVSEVAEVYEDLRNNLLIILNEALDRIFVTRVSGRQIGMFLKHFAQYIRPIPDFLGSIYAYYTEDELKALGEPDINELGREAEEALKVLNDGLGELGKLVGKRGVLYTVCYSHLDLAWLWSVDVTRQKIRRTVGDMISIHSEYPEIKFVWSNAAFLSWLEKDDPVLFERLRQAVKEGWVIPVGGMWVESDTNLPGGESLARQFLYGQKYLLTRFGRIATVGWLPDTFGFPASLPQILRKAGLRAFLEAKLSWSTVDKYPYSVFLWEGIDGTRILTINSQQFWGEFHPNDIKRAMQNHSLPNLPAFQPFGRTDGGGSTTWISMERYRTYKDVPGMPEIIIASPEDYVELMSKHINELPVWRGELYLETHRGVYSNGTVIKRLVRDTEVELRELELWSVLLGVRKNYEELWYPLLEAEYHDPMGATNTRLAYEDVINRLVRDREVINKELSEVLSKSVDNDSNWVTIYNSLPWDRTEIIKLDRPLKGLPMQRVDNGYLVQVSVPGIGRKSFEIGDGVSLGDVVVGDNYVENSLIRIVFDGSLKVYDKEANRWAVEDGYLMACEDIAIPWSGWNLEGWYRRNCKVLSPSQVSIVEKGPLRGTLMLKYVFNNSEITQWIYVKAGSRVVEFRVEADWRERFVVVRNEFRLGIKGLHAVYEIPYGIIERPNRPSNSWEAAKFEVPAWRWGDLGDNDYGVAILNRGVQGYNARDNVIGITLWRSPMFPNPFLDYGHVSVEYAIYPHIGNWVEARVPKVAQAYNTPLRVVNGRSTELRFLTLSDDSVLLESVKLSEDGNSLVLRLWEPYGKYSRVAISVVGRFDHAEETDLLERGVGGVDVNALSLQPFEIKTVALHNWSL